VNAGGCELIETISFNSLRLGRADCRSGEQLSGGVKNKTLKNNELRIISLAGCHISITRTESVFNEQKTSLQDNVTGLT
jgi:hypothetical protein